MEGVVSLDDPVGPPGSTLRHLLCHASGLSLDSDQVLARPGTRRIYSNRGIDLAAEHLETRTGRPFADAAAGAGARPAGPDRHRTRRPAGARRPRPRRGPRHPCRRAAPAAARDARGRPPAVDRVVPRPRRRGAGLRPPAAERLGARLRGPRPQEPALDGTVELAGDVRALRPAGQLRLGRPGGRARAARPPATPRSGHGRRRSGRCCRRACWRPSAGDEPAVPTRTRTRIPGHDAEPGSRRSGRAWRHSTNGTRSSPRPVNVSPRSRAARRPGCTPPARIRATEPADRRPAARRSHPCTRATSAPGAHRPTSDPACP